MKVWGLAIADLAVLVVYLLGITVVGIWMARRVKSIADFFMPRRFGKSMMMMHAFGTGTHSDQAVGVASQAFTGGLSGIWLQWLWLFSTPFYWLIAPVMRRFRALTTADVFEARYGRSVGMLYAIVGATCLTVATGLMLMGSSKVLAASTGGAISSDPLLAASGGGAISADWWIVIMTVLFVAYGVAGGLAAAIVTDFIQGILTIIFSFLLLPFVLDAVGGLDGIRATIAEPDKMFSLVAPGEIGVFYIAVVSLNALIGIVTQPHTMGNCAAGRTELDGRVGFTFGTFIKRICTGAWCLTGLAALAYFGTDKGIDPDGVYGKVASDFLPQVLPGLLGVFLAALLASVMSSCDSFMIATSGLLTENFYKPLISGRSKKHYVLVARIASLCVVGGGVFLAYRIPTVKDGLAMFWKVSAMMGLAFWLGLFWRRATAAGAWASTLAGFAAWWVSTQAFFIKAVAACPWAEPLRLVFEKKKGEPAIYLPWQMVFYLTLGLLAGTIVSLLTRPPAKEKLDRFYALIRTPVRPGEEVLEPCTLPEGAVVPEKRALLPGTSLEILVPSRRGILGFLGSCGLVAAIIYGFIWIVG